MKTNSPYLFPLLSFHLKGHSTKSYIFPITEKGRSFMYKSGSIVIVSNQQYLILLFKAEGQIDAFMSLGRHSVLLKTPLSSALRPGNRKEKNHVGAICYERDRSFASNVHVIKSCRKQTKQNCKMNGFLYYNSLLWSHGGWAFIVNLYHSQKCPVSKCEV